MSGYILGYDIGTKCAHVEEGAFAWLPINYLRGFFSNPGGYALGCDMGEPVGTLGVLCTDSGYALQTPWTLWADSDSGLYCGY